MFSTKCGALRKALRQVGVEIVFPTAPHQVKPEGASYPSEHDNLRETEGNDRDWPYWAWGFADDNYQEMRGLDKSINYIGNILVEQVTLALSYSK